MVRKVDTFLCPKPDAILSKWVEYPLSFSEPAGLSAVGGPVLNILLESSARLAHWSLVTVRTRAWTDFATVLWLEARHITGYLK